MRAFLLLSLYSTLAGAAETTPFDPAPAHLWNRLHHTLFTRTAADGRTFTHEIDPLFFPSTKQLLIEPSHQRAIDVLDEFLKSGGETLISDPLKRAILQRDLWALFDWNAWIPDEWVHHSKHEPASRALRARLATLIKRLALSDAELLALPDNYAQAIAATSFSRKNTGEAPFLPPDLFSADGPWVLFANNLETVTPVHTRAFGGRSVFFMFLNLPGGRAATEDYIRRLRKNPPQFPAGTQVALVRRALLIDTRGKIAPSHLTESVQLRIYVKEPAAASDGQRGQFGDQLPFEFSLKRASLFAGTGGLSATHKDHRGVNFLPGVGGTEIFEAYKENPPPDPLKEMRHTMSDCLGCHNAPGIHSVLSIAATLRVSSPTAVPRFETIPAKFQIHATLDFKQKQYTWGLLQGYLETTR